MWFMTGLIKNGLKQENTGWNARKNIFEKGEAIIFLNELPANMKHEKPFQTRFFRLHFSHAITTLDLEYFNKKYDILTF